MEFSSSKNWRNCDISIGEAGIEETIDCKPISKRERIKFIILVSEEALSVPARLKVAARHFNFPWVVGEWSS